MEWDFLPKRGMSLPRGRPRHLVTKSSPPCVKSSKKMEIPLHVYTHVPCNLTLWFMGKVEAMSKPWGIHPQGHTRCVTAKQLFYFGFFTDSIFTTGALCEIKGKVNHLLYP